MLKPRIKFTVADYMTTPEDKRYQLLDGELILAAAPTLKHQKISIELSVALHLFANERGLGIVRYAPVDVVLSEHDVAQPDILFVSNERADIITEANIQGAPDLVIEVLSPSTKEYDRGYKLTLYSRHWVREYWLIDPIAETVEVLTLTGEGLTPLATFSREDTLTSPLLPGLAIDLKQVFSE